MAYCGGVGKHVGGGGFWGSDSILGYILGCGRLANPIWHKMQEHVLRQEFHK